MRQSAIIGDALEGPVALEHGRPVWIWLDVAALCNLNCKLCYTTAMRSRNLMTFPVFEAIIDRIANSSADVVKIHLNWRGEPVLNPHLPQMLAYVWEKRPQWAVEWHTNGTRITRRLALDLIEAHGAQTIFISLDGGNEAAFEQNRGRGQWQKALRGLEYFIEARGTRTLPIIGVYQLDMGVAEADYDPRFVALVGRVDLHVSIPPVSRDGAIGTMLDRLPIRNPCFWLGNTLAVDSKGTAFTCLLERGSALGSLVDEDLDVVLNRAAKLRDIVQRLGRSVIQGCSTCRKKEGTPTHSRTQPDLRRWDVLQ